MAVYQLENEHIYLEVASHGAELVRLVGKKTKKDIYLMETKVLEASFSDSISIRRRRKKQRVPL